MQAGFLSVLLDRADLWIKKRRENAAYYSSCLSNIDGLLLPDNCEGHAWNQYTLRTESRDSLKEHLDKNKIGNSIYYPSPLHESFRIFGSSNNLPETSRRCKEVLSIPIYTGLKDSERECVVNKIKEFFNDT